VTKSTTSPEFFEQKYRELPDPWDFARSDYERSRYEAIIAALGTRRYERAFEPGCSVGELTWRLAELCGHLDAMDISSIAVERARFRCNKSPNVTFHVGDLLHQIPGGDFDLVVLSEIGYYFEKSALRELGNMVIKRIRPGGTLFAAHWLGSSTDHLLSGDSVHKSLGDLNGLRLEHRERHPGFRLDKWMRI
jgi:trans-aconitate methyltransferase